MTDTTIELEERMSVAALRDTCRRAAQECIKDGRNFTKAGSAFRQLDQTELKGYGSTEKVDVQITIEI